MTTPLGMLINLQHTHLMLDFEPLEKLTLDLISCIKIGSTSQCLLPLYLVWKYLSPKKKIRDNNLWKKPSTEKSIQYDHKQIKWWINDLFINLPSHSQYIRFLVYTLSKGRIAQNWRIFGVYFHQWYIYSLLWLIFSNPKPNIFLAVTNIKIT
jgi:hypothetical protein